MISNNVKSAFEVQSQK